MNARSPHLNSKLPNVGTTIFTVMSALATERKAINLGQGFPDFNCDPGIVNAVTQAMQQGFNQYPPMAGALPLRQAVSEKIQRVYGVHYDPQTEITIAAGGTEAIFSAVQAVVRPGDEVIVLEPCYDSYIPAIELAGGTVVTVPLTPGSFRPNFAAIESALNSKTRLLIINTPHNPSAVVWQDHELLQLQALLEPTNTLLLSDEVYEHMVY
ncbi:MAG: aminotransferase class I/II-fold pyridoxal phosphate-dependent enzyme, partial [Burkholderiaceae bacterium]